MFSKGRLTTSYFSLIIRHNPMLESFLLRNHHANHRLTMHKYIHLISILASAFLALIALAACNDAEGLIDNGSNVPVSDKPIAFTASEEWNPLTDTRGTSQSSFSKGDAIGVFAYYRPSKTWNSSVQVFMNNQEVQYDGSNWSYAPMKYWPLEGDVVFYAYGPYEKGKKVNLLQDGSADAEWVVPNDVKKQKDVTNSATVTLDCQAASQVKLNFSHALARIRFKANDANDMSSLKVQRITLTSDHILDLGTLHFPKDLTDNAEWSLLSSNKPSLRTEYDFYPNESLRSGTLTEADLMMDGCGAFLIPQTVSEFKLRVLYEKDGVKKILDKDITAPTQWKQGKSYTYAIDFSEGKDNILALPDSYQQLDFVESMGYYKDGILMADKPHSIPINLMLHTNGGHYGVWMKCETVKYAQETDGSQRISKDDSYPFGALTKGTKTTYDNRFYGVGKNGTLWQCGWGSTMFHGGHHAESYGFYCKYDYSINYLDDNQIRMTEYAPGSGTTSTVTFNEEFSNTDYTDSDIPVYLFGICNDTYSDNGRLWVGRIYEAKISKDDADIMHLVPCRKDDLTVGMYDIIGQVFYPLQNGMGSDEGI